MQILKHLRQLIFVLIEWNCKTKKHAEGVYGIRGLSAVWNHP